MYEVMQKTRPKPTGLAEPLQPAAQPEAVVPAPADPPAEAHEPAGPAVRWQRPRHIQFNAGRLELTVPYPIASAIFLALILIVLLAYRLGQSSVKGP